MRSIPAATARALPGYRLPGLSRHAAAVVVDLAVHHCPDGDRPAERPRTLSVVAARRLTLRRLRRTATYPDLHEDVGVGTSPAGEDHPHRAAVGADPLGVADSGARSVLVAGRVCLVEGTLVPTVP